MIEVQGKGGIIVRIIADSISKTRITTFELEYPRMIHSEMMTHRMLSKNSSSTRAIPVARAIEIVEEKPAMPIHWGENNPGMSSNQELDEYRRIHAQELWINCMQSVISYVKSMSDKDSINGHKQWAGRWLETASFIKVVLTGTEFNNLYALRHHKDAQPEFYELVDCMMRAQEQSVPNTLSHGEWHLPYIDYIDGKYYTNGTEVDLETAKRVSTSCCAQASYRKLDNTIEKANMIFSMLHLGDDSGQPAHASPSEHQATPMSDSSVSFDPSTWDTGITHVRKDGSMWSGNFRNWIQHRQLISNEAVWE